MVTCGYAQGTTLRHAHPRAIVLNSVDSLTFNASHFSHTPSHSNSAPRPWMSQPTNRTPELGLPEPQRNNRTLPNNVARNSPRSFFDYASKRCNSNTANSKFEIVARELRATLMEDPAVEGHEDYSSDGPDQHHTPRTAHRTPHTTRHTPRARARTARAGPYRIMSHVIPHGHFSTTPQNVAIPTLRIQHLK